MHLASAILEPVNPFVNEMWNCQRCGIHPEPRGLCCDPRECWAASQQLPVPYLSIRGADNLASVVTSVSGFFFFLICTFFAKVAYGVGLSAKSLAHQSKARKMGHFFLSWHERPQQYSGSPFFFLQELFPSPALSFSSQLHNHLLLVLYTGCQAAGNDQTWALGRKISHG